MRKINLLWIAMMAVGLTACTQDDDLTGLASSTTLSGSVMTEISSSSSNAASTRFNGSTGCWEESDAIGVYLTNSDNSSILNEAENIEFTLSEGSGSTTGKFKNDTGITYPDDETAINFHCYYPYTDDMAQSYTLDISDQSENGYKAYELMYGCDDTNGSTVTSSGVTVSFKHKVAKATIYVTPPSSDVTVYTVTISGLTASATFTPIGGDLTLGDTTGEINPQCTTDEESTDDYETYEAIILPDTDISNLCLKFTTSAGYTYVWEISDDSEVTKIDAGYEYIFNIGLGTAPSSSAGSGSGSGSTTTGTLCEITGEAPGAYTASYNMTDEDGETVEIYSKAYDYDSNAHVVDVEGEDTDLGTVLSEYVASLSSSDASSSSLKTRSDSEDEGYAVALRFDSSITYNDFSAIDVPEEITTLMFICDDSEQASFMFTGFNNNKLTLDGLYFYNVKITGDGVGTSFIYRGLGINTIVVESCIFQEMDNVFDFSYATEATTMDGITITDSQFYDCTTIVGGLGSIVTITNGITFEDCTVGVSSTSINASKTNNLVNADAVQSCTITVSGCTMIAYGYGFRTGYGTEYPSVVATNSVFAENGDFTYWATLSDKCSGNYYVNIGDSSSDLSSATGFTLIDSYSDLFSSEALSLKYYLTSNYAGIVGDPRWYNE